MDVAGRPRGRRGALRGLPSHDQDQDQNEAPVPVPTLRGRFKLALIRDLAMGEWDHASLARIHGITPRDVAAFQDMYASEIAEVSAALSGTISIDTAGLWITRKQQRLAEYQQAIEDIDATIAHLRELGINWSRSHRDMFRARLDLYRQAADELGAYPQRTAPPVRQGQGVQYIIDSEDASEMT